MAPRAAPLFLARRPYRQRRVMDAARLLPLAGIVLFLLPVIWSANPFRAGSTAGGGLYLFAVWAGLIAAAAIFGHWLARIAAEETPADLPPPEEEDG